MNTEEKQDCHGYIIKLYKTINFHRESSVPRDTEFLVWMNFDGMKVIPIYTFDEYRKSLDVMDIQDVDMTCERQKLYLYCVDQPKDIFGIENPEKYKKMPLVTITMVNFLKHPPSSAELGNSLDRIISCYQAESDFRKERIDYEIMGTLSSHDFVIIFRSNSYTAVNSLIFDLRIYTSEGSSPISTTYSILALNKTDQHYWEGDSEIWASIRITLDAIKDPLDLYEKFEKTNIQQTFLSHKAYTTFGKFDIDIEGMLQSNKSGFLELYSNSGLFSGKEKSIYMTNTRFLNCHYLERTNKKDNTKSSSCLPPSMSPLPEGEEIYNESKAKADQLIHMLKECNVSEKLKQSIVRLVVRIFQAEISVYTNQNGQNYFELLHCLMDILIKRGEDSRYQEQVAEIITLLNILLDNRVSANIRDFEIPQNSLRFSGSSSKLLIAYSNLVNDLTQIIRIYKDEKHQKKKYSVFVTADIDSKITAKRFFFTDDEFRFITVKIPIDIMFYVPYTIPWLAHEIGHFLRVYPTKEERNRSYYRCVFSAFHCLARPFVNPNFCDISGNWDHKKVCNSKCCPCMRECGFGDCRFERFNEYQQLVTRYWNIFIMESGCQQNSIYQIPDDKKGVYIYHMQEICIDIRDAYEEALADVFMLKILNIEKCDSYLHIMIEYLKNNCISINENLPTNITIRLIAILMLLTDCIQKDNPRYEEFGQRILNLKTSDESSDMNSLCQIISKKAPFYRISYELFLFLDSSVKKQMDELFEIPKIVDLKNKILKLYSNIESDLGNFQNYMDFIHNYQ